MEVLELTMPGSVSSASLLKVLKQRRGGQVASVYYRETRAFSFLKVLSVGEHVYSTFCVLGPALDGQDTDGGDFFLSSKSCGWKRYLCTSAVVHVELCPCKRSAEVLTPATHPSDLIWE